MIKILMVDNYDSFTYNLYHLFLKFPVEIEVRRNDVIDSKEILELNTDLVVISPGPKNPGESGNTKEIIAGLTGKKPVLGVCLGMQAINEVFGGITMHAPLPVHGKTSMIFHTEKGIFTGIPSPFKAARYHSLLLSEIPDCLEVIAETEDGLPMAVRHREYQLFGVQFHPESFLTEYGFELIKNFLAMVDLDEKIQAA